MGVVVLLALGVSVVVLTLDRMRPTPGITVGCAATASGAGWNLSTEQADNAALIAATAQRRGLPARAVTIALATALQESKLVNVTHGDRDSLGLFQQRPSQGWGTAAEVTDPVHATNAFYDALVAIDGYENLAITAAAQKVQRSAFPDAYAQHEPQARAWASALTGWSPGALTCHLRTPDGVGSVSALTARVTRDQGDLALAADPPAGTHQTVVITTPSSADPTVLTRADWSVAQWAVAVAQAEQVTSVAVRDQVWTREKGAWAPSTSSVPAGAVRVTLAVA